MIEIQGRKKTNKGIPRIVLDRYKKEKKSGSW